MYGRKRRKPLESERNGTSIASVRHLLLLRHALKSGLSKPLISTLPYRRPLWFSRP